LSVPLKQAIYFPLIRQAIGCICPGITKVGHKGAPVARNAVTRPEQLSHTGDDRYLRPLAGSQQAVVMRTQPWGWTRKDACRSANRRGRCRGAPHAISRSLAPPKTLGRR
jgi:hypothetical protein